MQGSNALYIGASDSEVVFCLVPIHLTDTSLCGSMKSDMTIGRCVGRCFVRSPEHTSLFQTPVYRPFAANIVRWGGHTRNTVGKAETCINIRFLHKHPSPAPPSDFARSKPLLCCIQSQERVLVNFLCKIMQMRHHLRNLSYFDTQTII